MSFTGLVLLAGLLGAAEPTPKPKIYDENRLEDLERLADVLRAHVALVEASQKVGKDSPFSDQEVDGFGVVLSPNRVAALSFIVQKAKEVRVTGRKGSMNARVVLYDVERRVAILETEDSLEKIGLFPAQIAPKESILEESTVFALTSTLEGAGVVSGILTDTGDMPEYEGYPRTTLSLSLGMPVFDAEARFIGYARAVSWDKDRAFLITMEHVREAQSATTARAKKAAEEKPKIRIGR